MTTKTYLQFNGGIWHFTEQTPWDTFDPTVGLRQSFINQFIPGEPDLFLTIQASDRRRVGFVPAIICWSRRLIQVGDNAPMPLPDSLAEFMPRGKKRFFLNIS